MDTTTTSEAIGHEPTKAVKRGRPPKNIEIKKELKSVTWTETMVEALLKSRLVTQNDLFLNSKDKNAIISSNFQ
jgi:hypothetical protein